MKITPVYKTAKFWKWFGIIFVGLAILGAILPDTPQQTAQSEVKSEVETHETIELSDEDSANAEDAIEDAKKVDVVKEIAPPSPPTTNVTPMVATEKVTEDSEIKQALAGAVKTFEYYGHEIEDDALWLTLNAANRATRENAIADSLEAIKAVYISGGMNKVSTIVLSLNDDTGEVMIVEFEKSTLNKVDVSGMIPGDITAMSDYFREI